MMEEVSEIMGLCMLERVFGSTVECRQVRRKNCDDLEFRVCISVV